MLILVDQDGVLADFDQGFYTQWQSTMGDRYPGRLPSERRTFYLREDYPQELRHEVEQIYTAPGFFRDLPPVIGAIEAMNTMLELGHDVRICTAPINAYRHCVTEKFEWVEKNLGMDFVHRMILTKDKTLVAGKFLIDDKPDITGSLSPQWLHLLFERPYNKNVEATRPRINWANWQAIIARYQ